MKILEDWNLLNLPGKRLSMEFGHTLDLEYALDLAGYKFCSPSRDLLQVVLFSEFRAGYAIKWFAEYGWPLIVYSGKVHYVKQVCSSKTKYLLIRVGVGLPSPRSQVFGRPGKVLIIRVIRVSFG